MAECIQCNREVSLVNEWRLCGDCQFIKNAVSNPTYQSQMFSLVARLRDDSEALRLLREMNDTRIPERFFIGFNPRVNQPWEWHVYSNRDMKPIASGSTPLEAVKFAQASIQKSEGDQ